MMGLRREEVPDQQRQEEEVQRQPRHRPTEGPHQATTTGHSFRIYNTQRSPPLLLPSFGGSADAVGAQGETRDVRRTLPFTTPQNAGKPRRTIHN
jgi:hypothetical protein